mmetsp:Transcript_20642/g.59956  ORF Transcript_20642/g.59956 Transcript_20642/m.59956 type:complete len:267 (+) Transcript_20642:1414-2214(+)
MVPMKTTSKPNAVVAAVAPPTANKAAGIFGWTLGKKYKAAEVPAARAAADKLVLPIFSPRNAIVSMGFIPAGAVIPSAFGTWPVRIIAPTPHVNPAMTETGTNFAKTPARVTPEATCKPPQAKVMKGSASSPCSVTAPTTSKLMAAAGPVIAKVVPPKRPPATPETAAVTNPTSGGTPLATAMASDRGTAMQPTAIPAETSVMSVEGLSIVFHSGRREGMPRSSSQGLSWLTVTSFIVNLFLSLEASESSSPCGMADVDLSLTSTS